MSHRLVRFVIAATLLGTTSGVASAASIRDYTLITLGDYASQVEVEGSAFIGGNITGGGPIFGSNTTNPSGDTSIPNGSPALKLAGTIAAGVNQVTINGLGEAFVNATVFNTPSQRNKFVLNGNSIVLDGGLAAERASLASQMTTSSAMLALMAADSTAEIVSNMPGQPGPLRFNVTPGSDGIAVFNIAGSLLNSNLVQQIEFVNAGAASSIIVNVSGTAVTAAENFVGGLLSDPAFQAKTLFNFHQATTLNINAGIAGAVLAPLATVNVNSTTEGAVFANVVSQFGGEIHGPNYGGYLPPAVVPEPGTLALLGLALPAVALAARRRRRPAA